VLAIVAALLVGCGGGGGDTQAASSSTQTTHPVPPASPTACKVGKSALSFVSEPPSLWTDGPGPTLTLACLQDRSFGGAAIVGFASQGGGACVASYDFRAREAGGELCEQSPWTVQCEGHGCVQFYYQESGITEFGGPVEAKVKKIKVLVDGKPLDEEVMVARVEGKLARAIRTKEPFVYFVVHLHGCVNSQEVKIELFGAGGTDLGEADEWDVSLPNCPNAGRGSA
jgi:hypothetical protein